MVLFRANDRHPLDSRILIIDNMDEFDLWRERSRLGIRGIICDYPASIETLQVATQEIIEASKTEGDAEEGIGFFKYDDTCTQAQYRLAEHDMPNLLQKLEEDNLGPISKNIIVNLANLFRRTVTPEPTRKVEHILRVNSSSISNFHTHVPTLSFAFSQKGSVCCNGTKGNTGDEYTVGTGKVIIFDETVLHKSPEWDEDWHTNPRVNLII